MVLTAPRVILVAVQYPAFLSYTQTTDARPGYLPGTTVGRQSPIVPSSAHFYPDEADRGRSDDNDAALLLFSPYYYQLSGRSKASGRAPGNATRW